MTSEEIRVHYAQVACDSCVAPRDFRRSEADALYGADVIAGLPDAALAASRGCGDPVARAGLRPGETVLDLGSGGGIDAIIAARLVAPGQVYGLDVTPEMVALARTNAEAAGCANVAFLEGTIEAAPLPDGTLDVVISNCVVNLVEAKEAVFSEVSRLLKPGGRMVVSDILATRPLDVEQGRLLAEITGCRAGIPLLDDYAVMLAAAGLSDANFEPKTVYTMNVLREKAERKGHVTAFSALTPTADSATGSFIITARK